MVVVCGYQRLLGFADLFTYESVDGLVVRLINQADTTVYDVLMKSNGMSIRRLIDSL